VGPMVESIRVVMITQAEGPHLEAYLRSLPTDQLESLTRPNASAVLDNHKKPFNRSEHCFIHVTASVRGGMSCPGQAIRNPWAARISASAGLFVT